MTQEPEQQARSIWPDVSAQQAAGIVLTLYIVGFLVANASYARYEVTRLELLQTRYLGAALLFLGGTGIPVASGYAVYYDLRSDGIRKDVGMSRAVLRALLTLGFGLSVFMTIATFVTVPTVDLFATTLLFLIQAPLGVWGGVLFLQPRPRSDFQKKLHRGVDFGWALSFTFLTAGLFGYNEYPNIAPAFGGGAAWYGRLGLTSEAERDLAQQSAPTVAAAMVLDSSRADILSEIRAHDVVVVDRDANQITFLICNRARARAVPVTMAISNIRWQNTVDLISPVRAAGRLCRRPSATKANASSKTVDSLFVTAPGATKSGVDRAKKKQ